MTCCCLAPTPSGYKWKCEWRYPPPTRAFLRVIAAPKARSRGILALCSWFPSKAVWNKELKCPSPLPLKKCKKSRQIVISLFLLWPKQFHVKFGKFKNVKNLAKLSSHFSLIMAKTISRKIDRGLKSRRYLRTFTILMHQWPELNVHKVAHK